MQKILLKTTYVVFLFYGDPFHVRKSICRKICIAEYATLTGIMLDGGCLEYPHDR